MRLLQFGYSLIATPIFCLLMFGVFCPLILILPGLERRRALGRAAVRICLAAIGVRIRLEGTGHLPSGPSVAVANHASYMDGLLLTAALPGHYSFVVQDGASRWPLVGRVLDRMGVRFVNRTNPREGARQTRALLKTLREGGSLAIFAEGTFKEQPGLLPFKSGAFLLAARAGVPVVPAVIRGSRHLLGGGWRGFRWSPIDIEICAPIAPHGAERLAVSALRDRVRAEIALRCQEPDTSPHDALHHEAPTAVS